MYLNNSCKLQMNRVITQEGPCKGVYLHWLNPLLNKCYGRNCVYTL